MKLDADTLTSISSIRGRLRFLLKDTTLYGGAMAISRFFSLLTVPILARIFSRAEFGAVDAVAVLSAVFVPLMVMGLDTAVARFFYEMNSEAERREILSQAFFFELLCALFCTTVLLTFSQVLMLFFFPTTEYLNEFRIAILSLPFQVILGFGQNVLKWTFKRVRFLVISIGSVALTVVLTLFLVAGLKIGIRGVFLAQLLTRVAFAILSLFFCREWFIRPTHSRYLLPMLKFGWPYMLLGVSCCFLPMIDRYFIVSRLGLEHLGLYAAAARLAGLLHFPIGGFQTAWGPFAFALYRDSRAQETYNMVLLTYVLVLATLGFLLVAFARPLVSLFLSSKFLLCQPIVLPLAYGLIVDSISWITGIGIDLSKKTYAAVASYVAGVMATVSAMPLCIAYCGLVGAAYAMLLGRTVLTITKTVLAHRLYPQRFQWVRPILYMLLSFGLAWFAGRFGSLAGWKGQLTVWFLSSCVLVLIAAVFLDGSAKRRFSPPKRLFARLSQK